MKRFSFGLAILALSAVAESANALPQNTPIYRACIIRYANDLLNGNAGLFEIYSMHYAIAQAAEHCSEAGLR